MASVYIAGHDIQVFILHFFLAVQPFGRNFSYRVSTSFLKWTGNPVYESGGQCTAPAACREDDLWASGAKRFRIDDLISEPPLRTRPGEYRCCGQRRCCRRWPCLVAHRHAHGITYQAAHGVSISVLMFVRPQPVVLFDDHDHFFQGVLPARSPKPLMVHSICPAAITPAIELAVASHRSLWQWRKS